MSSSSNTSSRLSSFPKTGSTSHKACFTNTMRDRQARNKDPATGVSHGFLDDEAGTSVPSVNPKKPSRIAYAEDAYESLERRRWAATILDSPELLLMHSLSRGDGLAGTKHHFTKILCGYDDPSKPADKKTLPKKGAEISPKEKVPKPFTGAFEI